MTWEPNRAGRAYDPHDGKVAAGEGRRRRSWGLNRAGAREGLRARWESSARAWEGLRARGQAPWQTISADG
jgi:hypothetical protein